MYRYIVLPNRNCARTRSKHTGQLTRANFCDISFSLFPFLPVPGIRAVRARKFRIPPTLGSAWRFYERVASPQATALRRARGVPVGLFVAGTWRTSRQRERSFNNPRCRVSRIRTRCTLSPSRRVSSPPPARTRPPPFRRSSSSQFARCRCDGEVGRLLRESFLAPSTNSN